MINSCFLLLAALLLGAMPAHGERLNRAEQTIANFSFASQLGSGIYSVNGRTIQIYRLPFSWNYREPSETQWGVRLLMPITLGFYDYSVEDVLQTPLPRSLDTLSFVPGVELSRLAHHDWHLSLFAQGGIAKERTSTADALTWAVGSGAERSFDLDQWRLRYQARLVYAETLFKDRPNDAMMRLSNGLEARSPLPVSIRGRVLDYGLYALNEWYLRRPDPPLDASSGSVTAVQWEVGLTFGSAEQLYVWKIPLPRLGIGYRFGDSLSVLRVVFGAPF